MRAPSFLAVMATVFALVIATQVMAAVPHLGVEVVKTYPHDRSAFTEGLFFKDGFLYESTGLNGASFIRKVDLASGKVLRQTKIDKKYFGEGIAPWGDHIISLTWQTGTGFVWEAGSFKKDRSFSYKGEGWGLTQDGHSLIMSDGTPTLRFLDPKNLQVVRSVQVTLDGQPLDQVNELEWIKGDIYANIWRTRKVVRIDPATGKITAIIDLDTLAETQDSHLPNDAVANGIAYDSVGDHLYVTGKLWSHIYEVKLVPR